VFCRVLEGLGVWETRFDLVFAWVEERNHDCGFHFGGIWRKQEGRRKERPKVELLRGLYLRSRPHLERFHHKCLLSAIPHGLSVLCSSLVIRAECMVPRHSSCREFYESGDVNKETALHSSPLTLFV
jgi:hypothetical protein